MRSTCASRGVRWRRRAAWRVSARTSSSASSAGAREAASTAPVVLLNAALEANVALLDQVQEQQTAAHVLAGHRYHQTEVGLHQALACRLADAQDLFETFALARIAYAVAQELLGFFA